MIVTLYTYTVREVYESWFFSITSEFRVPRLDFCEQGPKKIAEVSPNYIYIHMANRPLTLR